MGYKRFKGRKSTPEEISELYEGLKDAHLNNFDVLLSGYCPSAAIIDEVGRIARERKLKATTKPGSFFWVLDPVMGDNGRIYVAEDCVPSYRGLLKDADLILPNQFEAELLSEVKIRDLESMAQAIGKLHSVHRVPHVLITSIALPPTQANTPLPGQEGSGESAKLSVIGSTATSEMKPRLFRITIPKLPVFFSGTGDMFAATLVARLRQATQQAGVMNKPNWRSDDDVAGPDLPLANATERVLASMHAILQDTAKHYEAKVSQWDEETKLQEGTGEEAEKSQETQRHLMLTRAAEVRVVRNSKLLREPPHLQDFKAQAVEVDVEVEEDAKPDELGVLKPREGGAVHQE